MPNNQSTTSQQGEVTQDFVLPPAVEASQPAASLPSQVTENWRETLPTPPLPQKPPALQKKTVKISQLGDYRLLKQLGAGGMGTVYKAHLISQNRTVALKVLSKQLAAMPTFLQRFYREARITTQLDHPHILRGYEVGEDHGWHYFAMECVEGGSLQAWLQKLGKLAIGDAVHVLLACARALQYAHEMNLVHRDVKPENILLTTAGVVKVADLGLAKPQDDDQSLTQTGTGAGTPVYVAPEQARNAKHVDGRSDIYSLGCTFYVLLTGQPPFKGGNMVELLLAKERVSFPPARRLNARVPERLDSILLKMLARLPEQRYQTCADLIQDLEWQDLAHDRLSFVPEN